MPSREGRHTAKLSTWMLRYNIVNDRSKALKLIKRNKVIIRGKLGTTKCSYRKVEKSDIQIKEN